MHPTDSLFRARFSRWLALPVLALTLTGSSGAWELLRYLGVLLLAAYFLQGLADDHAGRFAAEKFVQRLIVHDDLSAATGEEDARGRRLATACSVILFVCHNLFRFNQAQRSSAVGCWAACG